MTALCNVERWQGEESPGSMETRCRVTPGGGNPRESATENKPPLFEGRVKRWGKSPPRSRQRVWQGKPHREQDRVGTPCLAQAGLAGFQVRVFGWVAVRRPAMVAPEEWSSPSVRRSAQNPAYRPAGAHSGSINGKLRDRWPSTQPQV